MKKLFLSIILFATFAAIAQPVFAGDKVYACHITSYNFDTNFWEGHVIEISANAVATHCSHQDIADHHPKGVMDNAADACPGLDGKRLDQCVRKFAVGAFCRRGVNNENAVNNLCGS